MASVASSRASPLSGYEFPQTDPAGDTDENAWAFISIPGSVTASSTGFFPSPASGTLGSSWGFIGHNGHHSEVSSLPAASPLNLDSDQPSAFADRFFDETSSVLGSTSPQPDDSSQSVLDSLFQYDQDFFSTNSLLPTQLAGK